MMKVLIISDNPRPLHELLRSIDREIAVDRVLANERLDDKGYLQDFSCALLDLGLANWREILSDLRRHTSVVAFSEPDIDLAVEALKGGAIDYLKKPLDKERLTEIFKGLKDTSTTADFPEIIGNSQRMLEILAIVKKAASGDSNVLITGESGTGKELVAKAIHRYSHRRDREFVPINCSAIPDTLIESELFGFERGAFTGALYTKKGLIETANGGSLFFDEIGDASPLLQTKLLRVLQEGEFMRIGGNKVIKVDVRVVAATNKNLSEMVSKGLFREDLFYRLNVINIHLPPLRSRVEDIPLLVRHFIKKHAPKRRDLKVKGLSEEALSALIHYPYAGNVRELENIIERAIALTNSPEILPSDLPPQVFEKRQSQRPKTPRLKEALNKTEKEVILSALNESGWNISRAALLLGVYRQFLQKKIRELSLSDKHKGSHSP